ncbi:hypothetical protein Q9251_18935 [Alkalihalobacillus macyae]|uniref:hypothetical protein n=1 Tax=Guptibacillus hwajinpoensis TaxID=208199 RepID=UPI00273AC74E|nr:hypothetical protein [Alkalihalobacillus macyae]MDP4552959.1 hypothetical protein [Alkalihalobacillus macyae]
MIFQTVVEIFALMRDEYNRKKAQDIYRFIQDNFQEIEVVSLKRCISIAGKGYIKFATLTPSDNNALLLHFPNEIRDNLLTRKEEFAIIYNKPKRDFYVNQTNILLKDIYNTHDLLTLMKIAYDNPRRIRNN